MGRSWPGVALLLLPLQALAQCSSTWQCPGEGSGTTHSFSSMSECEAKVQEAFFAWKHLGGGGCTATACSCGSAGSSSGGGEAAAAAAQAREYVNQLESQNAELRGRVQALEGRKEELTRKKQSVEERKRSREAEWRERQRLWDLKDAKDELGKNLKVGQGGGLDIRFKDFIAEAENNRRWEKHRHAALALQREATAKNPANKENETWCKLNTLLAPGPERAEAWDRRCDPGRKVPPYSAAAPRLEPAFKAGSEAGAPKASEPPRSVAAQSGPEKAALQAEFKLPDPEPAPPAEPEAPTTAAAAEPAPEEPSEGGLPGEVGDISAL
ncbi:MAG: hypothetical protein HY928_01370, partial [Elusimicrobia bacterium]|nr:hypothetical protein [Elusimicrobiota bacterium]